MDSRFQDKPVATSADIVRLRQDWTQLRGAAPLAQVEAYWHALRGARLLPDRWEVDPRGIEAALGDAFILERIAPGHARIRIAGTRVADLLGMEVRGMPLSALFEPAARDRLQAAMRCLFDDPAIQKFSLSSPARIGKPPLKAQMALYPLRSDSGAVARALGVVVTEGEIGRAPRRFDLLQARRQVLSQEDAPRTALPAPETAPGADEGPDYALPAGAARAEAAEPAAAFKSTAVPWLRVVRSDAE